MTPTTKPIEQLVAGILQSNEIEQLLLESADEALFIHDLDGRLIYVNSALETLTGYSKDEASEHSKIPYIHHDDRQRYFEQWHALLKGEKIDKIDFRIETKGGETRWHRALWKIITDTHGNAIGIQAKQTDITSLQLNNEKLQQTLRSLKLSIETAKLGIWTLDIASGRLDWNDENLTIYGITREDFEKDLDAWRSQLHADDVDYANSRLADILEGKSVYDVEFRIIRPTGEVRIISASGCPNFNSEGEIIQLIGINIDITERKDLEKQVVQAQKMEAIGSLAGGIAHEFNNLLVPILGHTELLLHNKSDDDPELHQLNQIHNAGIRAKQLVKQILAYGRQSMSKAEPVSLTEIIHDTMELIQHTIPEKITIRTDLADDASPILGMSNELHQVVLNLSINAIHAMPDGGELSIELKTLNDYEFTTIDGVHRRGRFNELCIKDNGTGIAEHTLERIFDPFFTTKKIGHGTGLGLSVVQGIIEQHNGQIVVETKLTQGTTFHVFLPVASDKVDTSVDLPKPLTSGHQRIMLVDDEPMIVNLTKSILESLGYTVTDFIHPGQALEHFESNSSELDLVLTDYGMKNMNGGQLATKIKALRPDIPIILMTGYGDMNNIPSEQQSNLDSVLKKPFNLNELSEVVKTVLN